MQTLRKDIIFMETNELPQRKISGIVTVVQMKSRFHTKPFDLVTAIIAIKNENIKHHDEVFTKRFVDEATAISCTKKLMGTYAYMEE